MSTDTKEEDFHWEDDGHYPVEELCNLLEQTRFHNNNDGCLRPTHMVYVGNDFIHIGKLRNKSFKVKNYILLFKDDTEITFNELDTVLQQSSVSNIPTKKSAIVIATGIFWVSTTIATEHIYKILLDVLGKNTFVLSTISNYYGDG